MDYRGRMDPKKADNVRVNMIDRAGWGAFPPAYSEPLAHPTNIVMFYHNSGVNPCHNHEQCVRAMQTMQKQHMERGLPDIAYNFLIGGDGTVYEGRGWHVNPSKLTDRHANLDGLSLDIAYIGTFNKVKRAYPFMAHAGINLLNIAVLGGYALGTFRFIEDIEEKPNQLHEVW